MGRAQSTSSIRCRRHGPGPSSSDARAPQAAYRAVGGVAPIPHSAGRPLGRGSERRQAAAEADKNATAAKPDIKLQRTKMTTKKMQKIDENGLPRMGPAAMMKPELLQSSSKLRTTKLVGVGNPPPLVWFLPNAKRHHK